MLARMDFTAMQRVHRIIFNPNDSMLSAEDRANLSEFTAQIARDADVALTSPSLKGSVAQNVEPILKKIRDGVPPTTPPTP